MPPWAGGAAIAAIVVVALLVVYGIGVGYFQNRLFPNTTIGGKSFGLMTYEEANAAIPQAISDYKLTVSGEGENITLEGANLGITPAAATVQSIGIAGNPAAWPIELLTEHSAPAAKVATVDEQALANTVKALVDNHNAQATAATSALVSYDAASNTWQAKDAVATTMLNYDSVLAQVRSAVGEMRTSVTLTSSDREQNGVTSTVSYEALVNEAKQLNSLYNFNFTLQLGSSGTCQVNRRYALEWVDVDAQGNVTASQAKFNAWVERLCDSLNTLGGTHEYTRADGKAISVTGGTYGWVVDRDAITAAVNQGVSSNSQGTIEVACTTEGSGFQGPDGPDFGRYVDVDITEQHARLYEADGTIVWETDVITGYDDGTYDTPTGVYVINRKESPSVLQSSLTSTVTNADGTTETVTQTFRHDVEYWMPFISNFIGFHDAPWQDAGWGGDLYHDQRYGSGGCVNLPTEMAASLYDLVEAGTVVSVHY